MIACNFFNQKTGEWLESIASEKRANSAFFRSVQNHIQFLAVEGGDENIIGFIIPDVESDYRKAADNYCRYGKIELFAPGGKLQAMYLNDICIRTFY